VINVDEVGEVAVMHGVEWTPGILRHCYFATIEHWRALGIEPDRLAAMAPGVGEKYGTFRVKRRHLERQPFDQVKAIELVRLAPGGANETAEWEAFTTFSARSRALVLGVVPSVLGPRAESLMSHFREVVQMAGGTYGYRYLQRMAFRDSRRRRDKRPGKKCAAIHPDGYGHRHHGVHPAKCCVYSRLAI